VQKVYFLHSRCVGSDGQRNRLKAMQEQLRESKCENMADVTGFCTEILAGVQLSSFEGLGKNSHVRVLRTFARQFPRAVASSLHVSDARVPARGVRAHGKDSCWIVTLASGGAVHRGEQAVVLSAAISIKDSKPKPAEFIRQRFCYCVTGWLRQEQQRSGRRRTGRIGRLRAITESDG
jgi:hypothetical protein